MIEVIVLSDAGQLEASHLFATPLEAQRVIATLKAAKVSYLLNRSRELPPLTLGHSQQNATRARVAVPAPIGHRALIRLAVGQELHHSFYGY